MRKPFRAKNLSVALTPSGRLADITDKLRICILHTNICLGWTHCKLLTTYCLGWISWCRFFTCRWGSIDCGHHTWIACRVATQPDPDCGPGSIFADPGDILIDPEIYARQVRELKADLTEALKQLEVHEEQIAKITKGGD